MTDEGLQATLDSVLDGRYGVYIKRMSDGAGAVSDERRAFLPASIFKVFVMWEAFRQLEAGLIDFSDTMVVTPYYASWELGTGLVGAGDVVTIDCALRAMMSVSDTPTAVLLQDALGFEAINASLQSLGVVDSGLFYPGDAVVTARDLGVLLEAIYLGTGVSEASRDEMIDLLLSEQIDQGLRAGTPAGVPVAHKTGSLPGAYHDGGIVFGPAGDYVIVVLSDGPFESRIGAIAAAVYGYFNPEAATQRP